VLFIFFLLFATDDRGAVPTLRSQTAVVFFFIFSVGLISLYKVRCGKCKTWNTIAWLITDGKNGQCCSKGNHPSSFNYA
jgi:hypothetical protein